jgi:hypothetical protein
VGEITKTGTNPLWKPGEVLTDMNELLEETWRRVPRINKTLSTTNMVINSDMPKVVSSKFAEG